MKKVLKKVNIKIYILIVFNRKDKMFQNYLVKSITTSAKSIYFLTCFIIKDISTQI